MRKKPFITAALLGTALLLTCGCSHKTDASKDNFKTAIGNYYNAHPECVWANPVKFPVEADPTKGDQSAGYDALTDAGLLTRTAAHKSGFLGIGSKQVNDYDLSDKGRSTWSPESTQPGYGNFCYGHREVTAVDNFVANGDKNGQSVASADYHYKVSGVSGWADSTEMKTAFPTIQAGQEGSKVDKATLILTNDGWQFSHD